MNKAVIDKVQKSCREGNRESVLEVFQNHPEHFSCIPLNDSNVEPKQAINDLLRENVILNGVKFFGHGELFLETLRQMVDILSRSPDYKGGRTGTEIVERVLCKASRTTSGSDSYFTVEQLFTNSDYLLKPRAERLPPIEVEVLLMDNSIHSVVKCENYYGLFSLNEIEAESKSFRVDTPQAWLRLDTRVVEKTDYLTGRNVRYLEVNTPDLPTHLSAASGRIHNPPANGGADEQHHHSGGGGGGSSIGGANAGNKSTGQGGLNGWAPAQVKRTSDSRYGD